MLYCSSYIEFTTLTLTEPWGLPTEPGLCGPCLGSGLDVIWWLASVMAYAWMSRTTTAQRVLTCASGRQA